MLADEGVERRQVLLGDCLCPEMIVSRLRIAAAASASLIGELLIVR